MTHKQKHDDQSHDETQAGKYAPHDGSSHSTQVDDEILTNTHQSHTALTPNFEHGEKYHEAGKRDVELYIRTYNTLLRSSGEISLKALVQAHYNIDSSLHPDARKPYPDMSAFIYSVLRLPDVINRCELVLLGQSEQVFCNRASMSINGKP